MTRQSELEIRKASEVRSQGRTLTGYVAKFNSETRIGRYREIIAPGAFTDSLNSGADILALADHDTNAVIGRSKSGTLNNYPGSVRTTGSNGAQGGPGADGCIILYYRRFGQTRGGPLVQKGGGLFFDRLNKLFIV